MATDKASALAAPGRDAARGGTGVVGRSIVLGVLALTALGAALVLHDAGSTSPVMSVPTATVMPRPTSAAVARRDALSFVPSGATLSVGAAIAAATGIGASALAGYAEVRPLAGGGYRVDLAVPVDEHALLRDGRIFLGAGQGASNLKSGLLQVTSGQVQFVVRVAARSGDASFAFRLSKSGETLSAMNWNANTVLSQTEVGDQVP